MVKEVDRRNTCRSCWYDHIFLKEMDMTGEKLLLRPYLEKVGNRMLANYADSMLRFDADPDGEEPAILQPLVGMGI